MATNKLSIAAELKKLKAMSTLKEDDEGSASSYPASSQAAQTEQQLVEPEPEKLEELPQFKNDPPEHPQLIVRPSEETVPYST